MYVLNLQIPMTANAGPVQTHCTRPRHSLTISMTQVAVRKPDTRSRPPNMKELETTLTAMKVKRVPSGYMHHTSPVCHH